MWWACSVYILSFFFFKQKTAYEMRISDWSSDVCSSDLIGGRRDGTEQRGAQSSGQPRGQGAPRSGRKVEGMSRHVAPPRSRCRLVVESNADQGTTKKPKTVSPDFSAGRRKETGANRSEEHTSELQSLMSNSSAVFCLKNKNNTHIEHMETQKTK